MIIECKNCSSKFNFDENRLRLNGSKVKCTKCGEIFLALPPFTCGHKSQTTKEIEIETKKVHNDKADTPSIDRRMYNRIKVSVPASCISTDSEGNPLDLNIGSITDVSQEGLAIEIYCSSSFEYISLSFISLDDKEVKIKGKVVHAKRNVRGKNKIGLSLLGTSKEIAYFVSQLVRYHHYATKPLASVQ